MRRTKKLPVEMQDAFKPKTKVKRKRKPMSEEQKAAAVERLAKARAAKGKTVNKSIPEEIRNIPDDNPLSVKNVRAYLKNNEELLKSIKSMKDSKEAKDRLYYARISTYVDNLKKYLSTGVYLDNRWGMEGEKHIKYYCARMAYHLDGTPKRSVGVVYPDCGLWTEEMNRGEF